MLYELLSNLPQEACGRITFEILESEKIRDFNEMVNFLNEIRKFGVKIAIDDFGAGFSNFTAILRVNPDFIKIMSLYRTFHHKESDEAALFAGNL